MKALILTGGKGTRLRPITDSIPKHLVPVANKPVIDYVVKDLKHAGISDIGIVVGEEPPNMISKHLGDGTDFGVEFTYIVQPQPKGLAHAVNCGREFISDNPFVVYFGDTIISKGVTEKLVANFSPDHLASLGLQHVRNPSRYGIARFNDNKLVGIEEKPDEPSSSLAYIGTVVLSPAVFEVIESLEPSDRGEYELTDAIDKLISQPGLVTWEEVDGIWQDVGKPEDVIETNKLLLQKNQQESVIEGTIEDGATVSGSIHLGKGSIIRSGTSIHGPVHISQNVTIGPQTHLGPYTSIGEDSHVKNASIESSILMNSVDVQANIRLGRSVIGPNTSITGTTEEGYRRCILGRMNSVEI